MAKQNTTLRVKSKLKEQSFRCHELPFEGKVDEPNAVTYAAIEAAEKGAEGSVLDKQNYEVADNEEIEAISKDLIEQNLEAYKKLAIRNYWLKNHIENY